MTSPILAWNGRAELGECPVWDDAAGKLWFCDIVGRHVHALHPATATAQSWTLPEPVCSFCLAEHETLLLALARRVVRFDPASGVLRTLASPAMPDCVRLNDGKLGPDGAFWVSGMHEEQPHETLAALWRVTPDGGMEQRLPGLRIGNGLAWSPDGSTMYLSDSGARPAWIDAWDFDPATGAMANRRRFATALPGEGLPDGACCDSSGVLWSAGIGAGRLNRYAPSGARLAPVLMPVPTPTMPCLGGGALWVTSLRHHQAPSLRARHPAMGGLFRVEVGATGLRARRFKDKESQGAAPFARI